jgi:carbon-monoxide dehydrogenase small subunit
MIRVNINNVDYEFDCAPTTRLLDVLRKEAGFKAAKEGCGEGECGACGVLIDGKLSNSCLVAIGSVEGSKILTVEGIRDTQHFRVLDQAFADAGAVQCGYCIPAMIMAAEGLLLTNAHPTEADVRNAISGNICRCTGYNMIIEAVLLAAKRGEGIW